MHGRPAGFRTHLRGVGMIMIGLGLSTAASYGVARAWRGAAAGARKPVTSTWFGSDPARFATGRHLVAYVLVAAGCGFSTEERTVEAIRQVRDSLQQAHGQDFADISLVGIVLDDDIKAGLQYVQDLERSRTLFDQLSLGGSWLNEEVVRLVWRGGVATAQLPQILLVERRVDADNYPRNIIVQQDSVLLNVTGRDELIAWVASGTPVEVLKIRETHD